MKLPHLFVGLFLAAPLVAAPPVVTTLTPAGGQRCTTVTVTAAGTFDAWPVKVWSSSPGVSATADKEKGKFAVAIAPDAPLGACWLRFHDDSGASDLRPFVVGCLPEQAETEPNDNAKSAPVVVVPKVVNGVLAKAGDVDCFAVKLAKGQTLVASLDAHRTLRSPVDAVMEVLSADGTVIEQNHDARGLDPEIAFTAPAAGTFVVRVFAFPSAPDSSIRYFGSPACVYRLTLTTDEFVDFVSPLAVEAGKGAQLTLAGWNLKATTATLGKADTMFGVAHPFAIAREPHPCLDLTAAADKPLSPPFTATGRVEKEKAPAIVPITAETGKPISLRLESATLGLSLTPVLRVVDAAGKQLLKAEPATLGGGIDATFAPPKSGVYKIEVRDLFNSAGPRHLFRLQVTPAVPDVAATVASDRFTIAVGTPLDIPITVAKKNGFKDELVPFADGLPDGVTASVGTPAKPAPNAVVLRLTATKPGVSGPIRIGVGKKGDSSIKRFATAVQPAFERTTSDLWLTVSQSPTK
ncbi:MAG: PPC domain-containing protein [Gemmataceae bacterium]